MIMILQWIIVIAAVVLSLLFFIRRFRRIKNGEKCCGGCDSCPHGQEYVERCEKAKKQEL